MKYPKQTAVNYQIARIISIIINPFIIAPLCFGLILFSETGSNYKTWIYFIISMITVVIIPLIYIYTMKKKGQTSSMDIPERAKRIKPFLFNSGLFLIGLIVIILFGAPKPIVALMTVYTINTLLAAVITKYWKISIHGMCAGGPIAVLGYLISSSYYLWILALPLLVYSRVALKAHTVMQVIAGFSLGFILTIIQMKLILEVL